MSVLNRYFLMFASMYACVMAYFVLNGYSFGPKPIPITKTIDGALLIPGPLSDIALRGAVLVEPVLEPKNVLRQSGKGHEEAAAAEPEPESESEPEVEKEEMDSGVTDVVGDVVKCRTTHGDLIMDVRPSWAPVGSARFTELVEAGHFTQLPFYRVCPKYLTQFGHRYYDSDSYDPSDLEFLKDDPSLRGVRDMDFGYLFFTGNEANGRKSEMAISFCEMDNCDVTGLGHKPWYVFIIFSNMRYIQSAIYDDTGKFPLHRSAMGFLRLY